MSLAARWDRHLPKRRPLLSRIAPHNRHQTRDGAVYALSGTPYPPSQTSDGH